MQLHIINLNRNIISPYTAVTCIIKILNDPTGTTYGFGILAEFKQTQKYKYQCHRADMMKRKILWQVT